MTLITYKLQMVNVACYVGCQVLNHLLFADDAVIFARSAKGLQQLLDIGYVPILLILITLSLIQLNLSASLLLQNGHL